MDHQKKLDFVLKMTQHALEHVQHFDSGGTVLSGPKTLGTQNAVNPGSQGILGAIGNFLGTNNNFQASGVSNTAGTNTGQLNQAYQGAQGALNNAGSLVGDLAGGAGQAAQIQQGLAGQLQAQARGEGPNPAQALLNNQTGQNIAQAAALAAGTRGAGANAGLIAQNAAQQGANTQQQAVGQAALNQTQQQLAAQQQLQGLAATQAGQAQNAVQLQNQVQQGEQGILQGANTATNNQDLAIQENINNVNSGVAQGNASANSGLLKSIGSAINPIGGAINSIFGGGTPAAGVANPVNSAGQTIQGPAQSATKWAEGGTVGMPQHLKDMAAIYHPVGMADGGIAWQAPVQPMAQAMPMAQGGNVGTRLKVGGKVPGKPKVGHNDYSNDTVSAKLSPGEVVIDLNSLKDKGKLGQMARFVAKEIERKKAGRKLI